MMKEPAPLTRANARCHTGDSLPLAHRQHKSARDNCCREAALQTHVPLTPVPTRDATRATHTHTETTLPYKEAVTAADLCAGFGASRGGPRAMQRCMPRLVCTKAGRAAVYKCPARSAPFCRVWPLSVALSVACSRSLLTLQYVTLSNTFCIATFVATTVRNARVCFC